MAHVTVSPPIPLGARKVRAREKTDRGGRELPDRGRPRTREFRDRQYCLRSASDDVLDAVVGAATLRSFKIASARSARVADADEDANADRRVAAAGVPQDGGRTFGHLSGAPKCGVPLSPSCSAFIAHCRARRYLLHRMGLAPRALAHRMLVRTGQPGTPQTNGHKARKRTPAQFQADAKPPEQFRLEIPKNFFIAGQAILNGTDPIVVYHNLKRARVVCLTE